MAGKANTFSQQVLKAYFFAETNPGLSTNATSSPLASTYVSLYGADPGAAGTQATNEVAYAAYVRVSVSRLSSAGWSITNQSISPLNNISFAQATSATGATTATHFGIGTSSNGAGTLDYFGTLSPNITINNGVTPILSSTSTITEA